MGRRRSFDGFAASKSSVALRYDGTAKEYYVCKLCGMATIHNHSIRRHLAMSHSVSAFDLENHFIMGELQPVKTDRIYTPPSSKTSVSAPTPVTKKPKCVRRKDVTSMACLKCENCSKLKLRLQRIEKIYAQFCDKQKRLERRLEKM